MSGVYRLIGLTAEHDVTALASIDRISGRDQTGTLYIGSAGNLLGRLGRLVRSLRERSQPKNSEHGAAERLSKLARSCATSASRPSLKDRLMAAVDHFNQDPIVHTWTYKLDRAA